LAFEVMTLDVQTLFKVTIYVEAILGLLLLFVWAQNLALRAVCWWGFAYLIRLASIGLFGMYGEVPDLISIDLANALLFTAFAVTWTGARVFDGRPAEPVYLVTGAVLWLLVCRLPIMLYDINLRSLIASAIIAGYTWLTAYEFWRGRDELLVSRWPAVFMFFAHGTLFLLRTPMVALLPGSTSDHVFAAHHLKRLHLAGDGKGAHRAAPPHRCYGRSAHRHLQSPRIPARCVTAREAPCRPPAAGCRSADRPRSLQVDQ
jgi:hypothetical protein